VLREICQPDRTLREAAELVANMCRGQHAEYAVASPDLWNRRQDTGKSGFEIMQAVLGMPPMHAADNRRIPGWRVLREYLSESTETPSLFIASVCHTLIESLPALLCDTIRPEDAAGEPHSVTHAPEALRYAVMSRSFAWEERNTATREFKFPAIHKKRLL